MSIKLPNSLIQSIQSSYTENKYKDGVFTFQNIDIDTIEIIIRGLLSWAEKNEYLSDNVLNVLPIIRKD